MNLQVLTLKQRECSIVHNYPVDKKNNMKRGI